eukprot:9354335-Pyramimonas_sp.AAC.2
MHSLLWLCYAIACYLATCCTPTLSYSSYLCHNLRALVLESPLVEGVPVEGVVVAVCEAMPPLLLHRRALAERLQGPPHP